MKLLSFNVIWKLFCEKDKEKESINNIYLKQLFDSISNVVHKHYSEMIENNEEKINLKFTIDIEKTEGDF